MLRYAILMQTWRAFSAIKKLDATSKNLLYNQELRRFLNLKKQSSEKPVKVEIANTRKRGLAWPETIAVQTDPEIKLEENPEDWELTAGSFRFGMPKHEEEDEEDLNKAFIVSTPRKRRKTFGTPNDQLLRMEMTLARAALLERHMRTTPGRFNVNEDGEVMDKSNRPIPGSDIKDIAYHLVNKDSLMTPKNTPPGASVILGRLRGDKKAEELISPIQKQQVNAYRSTGKLPKPDQWT